MCRNGVHLFSVASSYVSETAWQKAVKVLSIHVYEVRPRRDKRGVDLISDVPPFGRRGMATLTLSPTQSDTQNISAAQKGAMIRVYDEAGSVIEIHEHKGDFKEW